MGEEDGQGGVWAGCHEEFVVGQFCKDRGCDELGSVGVHHHVQGLQGEGGGACQVMGVWGQLGNIGCDWIVIMYWDYLGRVMMMCQAMGL